MHSLEPFNSTYSCMLSRSFHGAYRVSDPHRHILNLSSSLYGSTYPPSINTSVPVT
jgi:hypothetical protein